MRPLVTPLAATLAQVAWSRRKYQFGARYLTFLGFVRPRDMTMMLMTPLEAWLERLVPVVANVSAGTIAWPWVCATVSVVFLI